VADLATEPRWARNFGTFGSNAQLSAEMTNAYMLGFQGTALTDKSVMAMVKHFPGGGPQEFGLDVHLPSGKRQVYPGDNFDYHVEPFKKAIDNGLRVIMPYYGVPVAEGTKIFVDGLDANEAKRYGTVVDSVDQTDVVVLYLPSIFNGNQVLGSDELMDQFLSTILPDNNLAFSPAVLDKAKGYSESARLITVVDLNRPAILTKLNRLSDDLIGTFGVYDSVLFDVIFGQFSPQGKLPFEMPSSMASVMA
jgi:hypothetical protein